MLSNLKFLLALSLLTFVSADFYGTGINVTLAGNIDDGYCGATAGGCVPTLQASNRVDDLPLGKGSPVVVYIRYAYKVAASADPTDTSPPVNATASSVFYPTCSYWVEIF